MRERLKEVDRFASSSDSDTLAAAGRDMLIEITDGTDAGLAEAVNHFGDECDRLGY